MVFKSGSYNIPGLIAEIVGYFEATDDFNIYDSAHPGGYCLHHTPSNSYISFAISAGNEQIGTGNYWTYGQGITVLISSGYNAGEHTHTGTVYYGIIPLYRNSGGMDNGYLQDPYSFTVQYWIDKFGLVMTIQNQNSYAQGTGAFVCIEFPPISALEFNDGYKPIMFHVLNNHQYYYSSGAAPDDTDGRYYMNIRPFNLRTQTPIVNYPRDAYRSDGNSKIYFDFPYIQNERSLYHAPVFHTRRWFRTELSGGMAVGDIVNWLDPDAVTVHKFIISEVSCAQTSTKFYYGLPYENAYDYSL